MKYYLILKYIVTLKFFLVKSREIHDLLLCYYEYSLPIKN